MAITKEKLLAEIKSLEVQEANSLANANSARGAIQAYQYLISELEKEERENDTTI